MEDTTQGLKETVNVDTAMSENNTALKEMQ